MTETVKPKKLTKTEKNRIRNRLEKKRNSDNPDDCPIKYAYTVPDVRRFLTKEETEKLEEMIEQIEDRKAAKAKHGELLALLALHAYELSIDSGGSEEQATRSRDRKLAKKERAILGQSKAEIEAEIAELTLDRQRLAASARKKLIRTQGFEITKKRKIIKKAM